VTTGAAPRPWRFILLIALVASIVGAFLPMVDLKYGRITMGLTAIDLSFDMDKTRALAGKEMPRLPRAIGKRLESVRSDQQDLQLVLDASKWAVGAFLPGVLLGLLGLIGLLRKRAGRLIGALAIPLGLASIGAWFGLRYAVHYAAAEADLGKVVVALQVGAHALLVIGGLGLLVGIGALVNPDRAPDPPAQPPPPSVIPALPR